MDTATFTRPYVVSWNLTYRCNLACEHCYLDAGAFPAIAEDDAFADRRELSTEQCCKVVDDIVAFAPEALTILTGGEPLLRRDILEIVRYASDSKLWVVVGTNGVKITETLAQRLKEEGVRGLALSLDALDPETHDGFRRVRGAFDNTVRGAQILHDSDLPFIVQTTAGKHNAADLEALADFARNELGASVWNLYFLVQTGRGQFVSDLEPREYDGILKKLRQIQSRYEGQMVVNAKCAPHSIKELLAAEGDAPPSPFLKSYAGGAGGCPAGTHYLGIRPNGDVTPCPYLPVFGGNLKESTLLEVWQSSEAFQAIRDRQRLGGRCGSCELVSWCGGCRARAFGSTGSFLEEDPLCSHQPGTFEQAIGSLPQPNVEYGLDSTQTVLWDSEAEERMQRVPAFVRGMVVQRVESYCRERGLDRVTIEALDDIRSRIPAAKVFGRLRPS